MLLLDRQLGAKAPGASAPVASVPRTSALGASAPGTTAASGNPPKRVQLRFRVGGELLELAPGKTTIGSSPRCNVRIQKPGVQPLHCLIVHEAEGLSVRRWAEDTRLNGAAFDDAPLAPGDFLALGTVELEVIDPQPSTATAKSAPAGEPVPARGEALRKGRELARNRSRQLLAALRRDRTIQAGLGEEISNLRDKYARVAAMRDEIAAELRHMSTDMEAMKQELAQHAGLADEHRLLTANNDELGLQIAELDAAGQALASEKAALAEECNRLARETSRLSEMGAELTSHNQAYCEERDELQSENHQLRAQLEAVADENVVVTEHNERLNNERESLLQQNDQLRAEVESLSATNGALSEETAQNGQAREELQRQCEQLRHEIESLSGRFEGVAEENRRINDERDQVSRQCEQLRSELDSGSAEHGNTAEECKRLSEERNEAWRQNDQLRARAEQLEAEKNAIVHETHHFRAELDAARSEYESLQLSVHGLTVEKEAAISEWENLRAAVAEVHEQNDRLSSEIALLRGDKEELASANQITTEECGTLRGEIEQLQASLSQLNEQNSELAATKEAIAEECNQLRLDVQRIAELERKIQVATTERENTSSELYRALLQVSEMQARDDHHQALAAAHQALHDEFEKSAGEKVQLQDQLDRLAEERAAADAARPSLTEESAAMDSARNQLMAENAELAASVETLREQLDEQACRQAKSEARVQELEALGAQLEEARRNEAELIAAIAQLQGELANRQQAHADATERVAVSEQQFADQSQRLAESMKLIQRLEEQLASANSDQSALALMQDELQQERAAARREHAEMLQRISELEVQLEAAQTVAASAAATTDRASSDWSHESRTTEPAEASTSFGNRSQEFGSDFGSAQSQSDASSDGYDWAAAQAEQSSFGSSPSEFGEAATDAHTGSDAAKTDAGWDVSANVEESAPLETGVPTSDTADAWAPRASTSAGESDSGILANENKPERSAATLAWARQTLSDVKPADDMKPAEPVAAPAAVGAQPTSFIERYAHMFADEEAAEQAAPEEAKAPPALASGPSKPRTMGVIRNPENAPAASAGDEESIEQYMAKLMQRIRGDGSAPPSSQAPPIGSGAGAPLNGPMYPAAIPTTGAIQPAAIGNDQLPLYNTDVPAGDLVSKRRTSTPEVTTNLGALRALANESARRAISRHALRTYRRNAVTKLIVSTLAGVTSLWLMLESPSWLHVQFGIACISLVVAAYWAGQTYRTLLASFRIATYDGPDPDSDEVGGDGNPLLPIDV